ncbi:MAG: Fic family protein [Nanoarchaeota archaeon]|nr:Fic family protein [Nanoarchaeota archaeon]
MVYIYRKRIGNKDYYYLRLSKKVDGKLITKDVAYLGNEAEKLRVQLDKLPIKYSREIRKSYSKLNKFIESNHFLNKIKKSKPKKDSFLSKEDLEKIESCKLHWEKDFLKRDKLTQEEYMKNFIIEFAFNTASIEGNTITLKQAHRLLAEQQTPSGKTLREIYDLQNTETVFFEILGSKEEISHDFIIAIHKNLLKNMDIRTGYRTGNVKVFRSRFEASPYQYIKADMDILLAWYKKNRKRLHPLVLGTVFHQKFEKIHPFFDGNGRTGRILLNHILLKESYPPLIYRRKNRAEYLNSLSKADKCNLDKLDLNHYKDLIEFSSYEFYENYWNLFL